VHLGVLARQGGAVESRAQRVQQLRLVVLPRLGQAPLDAAGAAQGRAGVGQGLVGTCRVCLQGLACARGSPRVGPADIVGVGVAEAVVLQVLQAELHGDAVVLVLLLRRAEARSAARPRARHENAIRSQ
jgi:hypothetical protein